MLHLLFLSARGEILTPRDPFSSLTIYFSFFHFSSPFTDNVPPKEDLDSPRGEFGNRLSKIHSFSPMRNTFPTGQGTSLPPTTVLQSGGVFVTTDFYTFDFANFSIHRQYSYLIFITKIRALLRIHFTGVVIRRYLSPDILKLLWLIFTELLTNRLINFIPEWFFFSFLIIFSRRFITFQKCLRSSTPKNILNIFIFQILNPKD